VVCALAALAYAELASMVPVSGSAYTYTYGVFGESSPGSWAGRSALEYAVGASVVSVGWSGYMNGLLAHSDLFGWSARRTGIAEFLRAGPFAGGSFNLLAFLISFAVTVLLIDRHLQERQGQRGPGRHQDRRAGHVRRHRLAGGEEHQLRTVPARRLG
jgi:APA family basic amino acid/polyamine antiporter